MMYGRGVSSTVVDLLNFIAYNTHKPDTVDLLWKYSSITVRSNGLMRCKTLIKHGNAFTE